MNKMQPRRGIEGAAMQYRDNMTEAEAAALLAELAALNAAYAAADAAAPGGAAERECPIESGWLDKRGRP